MTIPCPVCGNKLDIRTLKQNSLYWLWITILGQEIGYPKEQMSVLLKEQFSWFEEFANKKTGEVLKVYESSADWSKKEFALRTQQIFEFASQYGIELPLPESQFENPYV